MCLTGCVCVSVLAAASARADDCDTNILALDLVNETHGYTEGLRGVLDQPARPDAPTAEFLAGDLSFAHSAPAAPLHFATVDSRKLPGLHAVCSLEERSDADSESEWSADSSADEYADGSDQYVPDVMCVTIDLEGLMARYQDQLSGSVAYDLENGGLLSAMEYAATQQMNVAVNEHYVDGLLRRVLYSWVELTKWSLGGHDTYMGPAGVTEVEVEGNPANVTVLDAASASSSTFSESESDYNFSESKEDVSLDGGSEADETADFEEFDYSYDSCMTGCFGDSYGEGLTESSSGGAGAGDGDSFLLEQKVASQQRAARAPFGNRSASAAGVLEEEEGWDSAVPFAVPRYAAAYAEPEQLSRIAALKGHAHSKLRARWAEQVAIDTECRAQEASYQHAEQNFEALDYDSDEDQDDFAGPSDYSGSLFGSMDVHDDAHSLDDRLADNDDGSDSSSSGSSVAERLLGGLVASEDEELVSLVDESLRTLASLQQAIDDAADADQGFITHRGPAPLDVRKPAADEYAHQQYPSQLDYRGMRLRDCL